MRLVMIALPVLLVLTIFSAFVGGGHRHRHRHHDDADFGGRHSRYNQPSTSVHSRNSVAQNPSEIALNITIINNALERAVVNEHITPEQSNKILNQEVQRLQDTLAGRNNNAQAPQPEFGAENRRFNHHRRRCFSPLFWLIGGLFKLGLLVLLLTLLSRFFGFRPWRRSLGFRRWQQAYADPSGTPVDKETPVPPEDEDLFTDDIARELEREEQAQKARQSPSDGDQPAKKKGASDSDRNDDHPASKQ